MSPTLYRSILMVWTIATYLVFADAVRLLDYSIEFLLNYPDTYPLPALASFVAVSHGFLVVAILTHVIVFGASLMTVRNTLSILKPVSKMALGATIGAIIVCAFDHTIQDRILEYGIFLVLQAVAISRQEQFFIEVRRKVEERKEVEAEKVERDGN